jgi:hypothetical protein
MSGLSVWQYIRDRAIFATVFFLSLNEDRLRLTIHTPGAIASADTTENYYLQGGFGELPENRKLPDSPVPCVNPVHG